MATGVEVSAAGATASCCLKCCCKQFDRYIFQAEKNVSDMNDEVSKLASMGRDVRNKVAAKKLGNNVEAVENWLKRSEVVDQAAKKVVDDYAAMYLPRLNFWSRYYVGKRAFRKLKKARELIEEKDKLEDVLANTLQENRVQEKQIETMVVGMDPYLERALLHICDVTVGVIGICGMGGVGKTTLLRKIHGEFLPGKARSKEFDKVVWAVVFKKSTTTANVMQNDITRLQNDIARELGLQLDEEPDDMCSKEVFEQRALPIFEYLSSRNFLLLLDDLWSPLELKSIGVPNPTGNSANSQRKHKVVLTSRSETVCGEMLAAPGLINVRCLDDANAWRLFEFNATKQTIASHKAIGDLAREVMRECQGLPLALNTIGKALSTKSGDPKPWRDARDKLRNAKHVEIPGMEEENAAMLHRLKISYEYLPSQSAQDCFLSCCLWPEDFSIKKVKLIECWLGLGFIASSSGIDDDIKTGLGIISSLKEAHLLEPGDDEADEVKMHDTIRDMSLWISSECGKKKNKWLVKAGIGMKTKQRVTEKWQECSPDTELVSLMNNLFDELPSVLPTSDRLKVLMLQRNTSLEVVPRSFLVSAPGLTYLDLSNTIIEELPVEISLLHDLQYLNLSESSIEKLPKELSCLKRLRHLLMNTTYMLGTIPYGIISKLGQLEILDVFDSKYAGWDADVVTNSNVAPSNDGNIDKGACLDEFKSRGTFLKWLGISLNSIVALQKLARCDIVSTRRLCLKEMRTPPSLHLRPVDLDKLLGGLDMLESLQEFSYSFSKSLKQVVIDSGSDRSEQTSGYCFRALEKLELLSLPNLEQIRFQRMPANEFFPRLRSVTIFNCSELKNVNWALYLRQLLHLELQFCNALVALIDGADTEHATNEIEQEEQTFPLLKTLTIHSLQNLTSLCRGRSVRFPALQVVAITQCSKLTQLNIRAQAKLREIRGGEEWWRGLHWEEAGIEEELLPYFRYARS